MEMIMEEPMVDVENAGAVEEEREWWAIDLSEWIGCFANIETSDGIWREGKVTDVDWQRMDINGVEHGLPKCIELNGDPIDRIDFSNIRRMRLR